ncbi:MAG: hypothetical protein M1835_002044 [Candelina submexicana]|nr:MAG: hypothetical protein M1835_002044 [Candelina submexicana]
MAADPFDSLLGLEDTFYEEGYQLGVADGSRAGRIEGRVFGLEKGFEKYAAMGRLHGRSAVWAGRLPRAAKHEWKEQQADGRELEHRDQDKGALKPDLPEGKVERMAWEEPDSRLSLLPENARLAKHIQTLYALVEPASLSTLNSEESVSDFDDRLKRATAKVKVITKLVGEAGLDENDDGPGSNFEVMDSRGSTGKSVVKGDEEGSIETISTLKARH